jgi:hypothetical protein
MSPSGLLFEFHQYRAPTGGSGYFVPHDGPRKPVADMSENNIVADALWWVV